jgi:hypothetical protein
VGSAVRVGSAVTVASGVASAVGVASTVAVGSGEGSGVSVAAGVAVASGVAVGAGSRRSRSVGVAPNSSSRAGLKAGRPLGIERTAPSASPTVPRSPGRNGS